MPPELEELITLPASMYDIWGVFVELHNSRSAGFSANPIAYSDIQAYYNLHQIVPYKWEIIAIKRLDAVVMQMQAEEQEKASKKNAQPKR
jgi:hypothetical protein